MYWIVMPVYDVYSFYTCIYIYIYAPICIYMYIHIMYLLYLYIIYYI